MMGFRVALFLALSLPLAAAADDAGAEVPLPAPGFDVEGTRTDLKRRLVELGGSRIGLFCGGGYLAAWIDRAYRDGYPADDLERRLARLELELGGRECLGTGEIGPYHFNKKGHQAVVEFPMNFGPFLRTVAVTAASGKWFDLHAEAVEPGGRSREDDVFGGIALMVAENPHLKLILSHTAMTNPANARRLLETYPDLMMNFKIVRHHDGWRNLEPVTDRKGNIHEDWAALFEAFSDRFMVGSDAKFGRPGFDADRYRKEVKRLRRLLGVLDPEAAERIAYRNARRIFDR